LYYSAGIVRFELQYKVYGPDLKNQQYFLPTSNVLSQSEDLNIHWKDGYRLDITVRAYDIFDGYVEDTTTVYKDTSPPSITDLWLTKGDRVNILIHSIADFTEMTYVNQLLWIIQTSVVYYNVHYR
jgi:hypothetical protein